MYIPNPTWFRYRSEELKKPLMEGEVSKNMLESAKVPSGVPDKKKKSIKVVKLRRNWPFGYQKGRRVGKTEERKKFNFVDASKDEHVFHPQSNKQKPEPEPATIRPSRKRKRLVTQLEELQQKAVIPAKKIKLETVEVLGKNLTPTELEDEVFKFVRLCRCEVDCENPTFFENLFL